MVVMVVVVMVLVLVVVVVAVVDVVAVAVVTAYSRTVLAPMKQSKVCTWKYNEMENTFS